ncbi:hypothetical protein EDC04DRAFT_284046 [Pisolithus marmoratus]|nr:hypothetical protein EDC04DRAFT_284046 [Pisolithus marmoratus]
MDTASHVISPYEGSHGTALEISYASTISSDKNSLLSSYPGFLVHRGAGLRYITLPTMRPGLYGPATATSIYQLETHVHGTPKVYDTVTRALAICLQGYNKGLEWSWYLVSPPFICKAFPLLSDLTPCAPEPHSRLSVHLILLVSSSLGL